MQTLTDDGYTMTSSTFFPLEHISTAIGSVVLSEKCQLRCWEVTGESHGVKGGPLKTFYTFLEDLPSKKTLEQVFTDSSFIPLVKTILEKRPDTNPDEAPTLEISDHFSLWTIVPHSAQLEQQVQTKLYEGGLKIWESSWDLIKHILAEDLRFDQCNVLELGCGHGIPGILAFLRGAAAVTFQDLNHEVLAHVTIPNVIFNAVFYQDFSDRWNCTSLANNEKIVCHSQKSLYNPGSITAILRCSTIIERGMTLVRTSDGKALLENKDYGFMNDDSSMPSQTVHLKFNEKHLNPSQFPVGRSSKHCSFLSCAWEELAQNTSKFLPESSLYDYILCSEALYRIENYPLLSDILHSHLKVGGIAFFAAKRYYFGIGGGILSFKQYIAEHCSCLSAGIQSSNFQHTFTHSLLPSIVRSFADSHSNIRDILMIQKISITS